MSRKSVIVGAAVVIVAVLAAMFWPGGESTGPFVEKAFPLTKADRLFDIGIVDADNDGWLDVYTSNHHFRQSILVADGRGRYRDVVSEWGLDQSVEFPGAELSFVAPERNEPGLYIYWFGTQFIVRAHKLADSARWRGTLRVNDPVEILRDDGFAMEKQDQTSFIAETVIGFSPPENGMLRMRPGGQGLPITFEFSEAAPLSQIYVGRGKVSPRDRTFALAMRDRHAMAWADYNGDGFLDVFINRGALSGTLRRHTQEIKNQITDELLLSQGAGQFAELGSKTGLQKKGCSGRHARWLDVDNDGRLDLFVNCYDRGNVEGRYPKQLYRQDADGRLHDVAKALGLGIPGQQIGSFAWFDIDNDADIDVLAFQDEGLFLYRNNGDHFVRELEFSLASEDAEKIGHTTGSEWFYDGKLSLADYDADGDLDAFFTSERGNVLLRNQDGALSAVEPTTVGLPADSQTGNWVDYDNDGRPDLHVVPDGLFRQRQDHSFERTGVLAFPEGRYDAAICNWADLDNDGRVDLLMAAHDNPEYKRWWEFFKEPKRSSSWGVRLFRNPGVGNHWLQLKLVGGAGNRQAIGARATVVTPEGGQTQEVGGSDGSFFSQGHYRLYFGLGPRSTVKSIAIRWPDGTEHELTDVPADQLLVVEKNPVE